MSKKPVVLMVLDGYGLNDKTEGNAIAMAASNAGGTYTSSGTYSSALSQVVSSKIDTKE